MIVAKSEQKGAVSCWDDKVQIHERGTGGGEVIKFRLMLFEE